VDEKTTISDQFSKISIRILLIDDHELITGGLAYLMQLRGWDVVGELTSADNLKEHVAHTCPTVIVADIVMPGPSLLSEYQSLHQHLTHVPKLVVLSAHFTDFNLLSSFDAGAYGIISKEDSPDQVLNAIESVCNGSKYFSEELYARLNFKASTGQRQLLGVESLTPREKQVLYFIAQGETIKCIAKNLKIAVKTADRHRSNLMAKLNCHSQVELVKYSIREGILVP
jgi:DNA-binding NarL/FixJ family response regulator